MCSKQVERADYQILAIAALVHLVILGNIVFTRSLSLSTLPSFYEILCGATANWDAKIYLDIAREGYATARQIVFFPLYPFLIGLLTSVLYSDVLAALLISFFSHVFACLFLYRLLLLDETEEVAKSVVLFSLVFPTAFFAVLPYTESLFFLWITAGMYSLRTRRFVLAGCLGFLAVLTRPTGVALIAMFAAEGFFLLRRKPSSPMVLLAVFLASLGVIPILMLNYFEQGDLFAFMHQIDTGWNKRLTLPHVGWLGVWPILIHNQPPLYALGAFNEVLGAFLVCGVTVYAFFRMRKSYAVYCLISAILITCQSHWRSNLRYAFVVFPIFLMLERWSQWRRLRYAALVISFAYLIWLSRRFANAQWAG